jgi:hypothetical protein
MHNRSGSKTRAGCACIVPEGALNQRMMLHRSVRRTLALGCTLLLAACYTERPLATPLPAPATRIVAELTDPGIAALSDAIGPGALEVEGLVATADTAAWTLNMLRVDHRDGTSVPWNREVVKFPRSSLTRVMEKRLDRTKSWLAAGAITAGAIIAARLFHLIGADEGSEGTPVPQELLIPVGGRRQ